MKNTIISPISTEVRQWNSCKKWTLFKAIGIWAIVSNLLISEPAKAFDIKIELNNPENNSSNSYRNILEDYRQILKNEWLTPDEIIAVEKIMIRDAVNRQRGIISKRAFAEIHPTRYSIRHSKEKTIKIPQRITRLNYYKFVDKIFDCGEFDKILTEEKIKKDQKEWLLEQMEQDRQMLVCSIDYMDNKYWKRTTNEWLNLFNKLLILNKEKTITKLNSLFINSQKLVELRQDKIGKSGLEKVQLEQEETMIVIEIYVTLYDKIDWTTISYTVRWKWSECYYII